MDKSIIRHLTVKYKKLDTKNEFFKKKKKIMKRKNKKFQKKVLILLNKLSLVSKK